MELNEAFAKWLAAENELARLEDEKKDADFEMAKFLAAARAEVENYETLCSRIMRENGVVEDVVEGSLTNYKLAFSTPRKTIDIADIDAVPDEWVKLERKPMKKELNEHFKDFQVLPNWARWKTGDSKLTWRAVKK